MRRLVTGVGILGIGGSVFSDVGLSGSGAGAIIIISGTNLSLASPCGSLAL